MYFSVCTARGLGYVAAVKVKLFLKYNPLGNEYKNQSDLETEINDWLAANRAIRIVNIQQSAVVGPDDRIMWAMSVWYDTASAAA